MKTKQQIIDGLADGTYTLALSEWGDGMRGVGLYAKGSHTPIERIVCEPWHVDQSQGLQSAEMARDTYGQNASWPYDIYGAHDLSTQARAMLVAHCMDHEDAILAWCAGDETQVLPELPMQPLIV